MLNRDKTPRQRSTSVDGSALRLLAWGQFSLQADLGFPQAFACFTGFLIAAFLIALAATGTYISANSIDYLFMVEQGWRLAQGQIPYRDFLTPIGPVFYALVDAIEHISHGDPAAYRLTGYLAMLLFGPGLVWICWRRLPGRLSVLIAISFAIMPISPTPRDGRFFDFEFLALYNSFCWPLMATVIVGALFESRRDTRRIEAAIEGLAIGLALVGLLGLKLTHGIVGGGVLSAGLLLRPRNRPALAIACLFVLSVIAIAILAAPDLLHQYLIDLVNVGKANNLPERFRLKLQNYVYNDVATLLVSLFAIWLIDKYRQYHPTLVNYRETIAAITIFVAAYAEAANDHDDTPASIILLFALLWLTAMRANLPIGGLAGQGYRKAKTCLLALPLLLWTALPLANSSLALIFHSLSFWLQPATAWPANLPENAPVLRGFKIPGPLAGNAAIPIEKLDERSAYLRALQDGITTLQALHLDHARIYEARFNNILSWLLQAPSPKGVLAWLDMDRTFSKQSHPPADTYLADVDVLLISKLPYDLPWSHFFLDIYGSAIHRDFDLIRETDCWQIYRRRPPS